MKAFILSLILFFTLIILIISNAIYVHYFCEELSSILSALDEKDPLAAEEICEVWHSHRPILSLSVHEALLERMDDLTENLKSAVTVGDGAEFNKNRALIYELISELIRNEELSFQGII